MRYATAFVLFFTLMLTGCASSLAPTTPSADVIKSYEVGDAYTSTTGSEMLSGAYAYTLPTFSPVREIETPNGLGYDPSTLQPGLNWVATLESNEGNYRLEIPAGQEVSGNFSFLSIDENGAIADGWIYARGNTGRGGWPEGKIFERVEGELTEGSFRFQLLYTGKSGSTISLVYREFLDGLQRADFSQELSYDLSESSEITFKSLVIDVVEATNNSIRYRVSSDDGLPWLPQV